ncbi:MAG: AsmA-like C-terminal region-containing protein, partial [Candidatus Competibacteraceae bacterium]|nr:AsmA-like C-terminal region-containing protein [Candidatus Competibacteraceae bacterium]
LSLLEGRLRTVADLQGGQAPVTGSIEVDADGFPLEPFLAGSRLAGKLTGQLYARADLQGRGTTLEDYLAQADGPAALYLRQGRVDKELINKLGLDPLELFTARPEAMVELECAAARFDLTDGTLNLERLVVVSPELTVNGSGSVDLASGRLDLTLNPRAQQPGLLELTGTAQVSGTLSDPQVNPGVDISVAPEGAREGCPQPGGFVGQVAEG